MIDYIHNNNNDDDDSRVVKIYRVVKICIGKIFASLLSNFFPSLFVSNTTMNHKLSPMYLFLFSEKKTKDQTKQSLTDPQMMLSKWKKKTTGKKIDQAEKKMN